MRSQAEIATRASILLIPFLLNAQSPSGACAPMGRAEDFSIVKGGAGSCGGRLVISKHSEPKTFNPFTASDNVTREITGLMMADLIHINRGSDQTEPALARSWTISPDGRKYTLRLRRGLRFSDGQPFDADDVLFTFQSHLDVQIRSPQRDLLIIGGKPIQVAKIDSHSVVFTLAQPYATAERLFDGFAILPRHLLHHSYETGQLASAWTLSTPPAQIAGLGPFRLKQYIPGQRLILERNPYYWKSDARGQRLPYLDEITVIFVANSDAEALRFEAGETDVISHLSAAGFTTLERYQQGRQFRMYDLGPGFEYSFLFFNLNQLSSSASSLREEQSWFQQTPFRQAIAAAIDRDSIVRLAFRGRAAPLSIEITPADKRWANRTIPPPVHSPQQARQLLRQARFSWGSDGSLKDAGGKRVSFSILVNAGNEQQMQMATLIQQDLKELGIEAPPVPLDFHSFLHRIFNSHEYEAAIIMQADPDSNPNTEMNFLPSQGSGHVWDLTSSYLPSWQSEIDSLMQRQLITLNFDERKRIFDQVQALLWQNMPAIFLASPDILVGAKNRIGNFRPAIFGDYTLWNAEQLFIRKEPDAAGHS